MPDMCHDAVVTAGISLGSGVRSTPQHGIGCRMEKRFAARPSGAASCPHSGLLQLVGSSPCEMTPELARGAALCCPSSCSAGMPPLAAAAAAALTASQRGAAQQCCSLAPQQDRAPRRTAARTASACRAAHEYCPPTVQQAGFLCCAASMCIVDQLYVLAVLACLQSSCMGSMQSCLFDAR